MYYWKLRRRVYACSRARVCVCLCACVRACVRLEDVPSVQILCIIIVGELCLYFVLNTSLRFA